jgi:hypothetical protein
MVYRISDQSDQSDGLKKNCLEKRSKRNVNDTPEAKGKANSKDKKKKKMKSRQ